MRRPREESGPSYTNGWQPAPKGAALVTDAGMASNSPMMRLLVALAMTLSACAGTGARLEVTNVDAPTVEVLVNDQLAATLRCGETRVLLPGGNLPSQPWTIQLLARDLFWGYHGITVDGTTNMGLLVHRGNPPTVSFGPLPVHFGPSGQPCPSPST